MRPHAVHDGAGEAERPGGQRGEVDGVDVAGDGGVPAPQIGGKPPGLAVAGVRFVEPLRPHGFAVGGDPARQVRAGPAPHQLLPDTHLPNQRERRPAPVGRQLRRPHRQVECVAQANGAQQRHVVGHVHQPREPERELAPAHQGQLQTEREHVKPGRWHRVAQREPADGVVAGQASGVLPMPLHRHARLRQGRHLARSRPDPCQRPGQQRPPGREVVEHDLGHQAPTRFCPQTRTTCPSIPPEAGSQK